MRAPITPRPHDAEGPDLDVLAEFGARSTKAVGGSRRISGSPPPWRRTRTSAASFSPTMARPRNLNTSPRCLSTSTCMRSTSPGRTGLRNRQLSSGEEDRLARDVGVQRLGHQHPAGLAQRLDDQHARHHRIAGEVALEERLVDGHALDADDRGGGDSPRSGRPAGTDSGAGSARRISLMSMSAGACRSPVALRVTASSALPCGLRHRWRARRSRACHWRTGRAGKPPQVSPAGMSFITPARRRRSGRRRRWSRGRPRRPGRRTAPRRRWSRCRRCPVCAASTQFRPTRTLWAICTRLSILVFSPITVSSQGAAVDAAVGADR